MSKNFKMNLVDWTALTLVIVGAINWGLVGVGYFVDAYRIVREERRSAVTYRFSPYDGFDPRDGGQLVQCRM